MIVHIHEGNVDTMWGYMEEGLARALVKTRLGELWDLDSAKERVKQGRLFGFYQPESGYSGLYSINTLPRATVLYFFWSGQSTSATKPIHYEELDNYLEVIAESHGCKYINCEGRLGWKSILGPLGYRFDSQFYSREVRE